MAIFPSGSANRVYLLTQWAKESTKSKRVLSAIEALDMEPHWQILEEDLSFSASHLFILCDSDASWVSRVAQAIRKYPNPIVSTSAILWLCEKPSAGSWIDPQIDDVLSGKESLKKFSERLSVRIAQAVDRSARAARAIENARSETILRQREEFLGVCAHDLRSPIGLVRSSLQMALKEPLSDLQRELLTRAERQSVNALALVEDLLDVMSYEQGLRPQYQLVNLEAFLQEFHKDYRLQADQKNIRFEYQNTIPDWGVLIDPDRVRQLLQNIFTNAVKFTSPGKHIYLRAESFQGRRRTDPPYPMVMITIRDEGEGISQKDMAEIFSRFSQGKTGRSEGRGLGLTVAKQIAQLHDGNVWAESREGEGTSFFALFPHAVSIGPSRPAGPRILIVEPNTEHRQDLSKALGQDGLDLSFARDGVEAVTLAKFLSPEIILFASQLEKLSVLEAAKILKDIHHPARRLLLGGTPSFDPSLFDGVASLPITPQKLGLFQK